MLFRAKRLRYKPSRAEGYSLLIEFHLSVSVRMFFSGKEYAPSVYSKFSVCCPVIESFAR